MKALPWYSSICIVLSVTAHAQDLTIARRVLAAGKFERIASSPIPVVEPSPRSRKAPPSLQPISPPTILGVFVPSRIFEGTTSEKPFLVDLTDSDIGSPWFALAASECMVGLSLVGSQAQARRKDIEALVTNLQVPGEPVYQLALGGLLGLPRVASANEANATSMVLLSDALLTRLGGRITLPEEGTRAGTRIVCDEMFIVHQLRAISTEDWAAGPSPRTPTIKTARHTFVHPRTRLASAISFLDHDSATGVRFERNRPMTRLTLAFWPDGSMIRLCGFKPDGAPQYEECTFSLASFAGMLDCIERVRETGVQSLRTASFGPDSSTSALDLRGFGEVVSIVTEQVSISSPRQDNAVQLAYVALRDFCRSIPVSNVHSIDSVSFESASLLQLEPRRNR